MRFIRSCDTQWKRSFGKWGWTLSSTPMWNRCCCFTWPSSREEPSHSYHENTTKGWWGRPLLWSMQKFSYCIIGGLSVNDLLEHLNSLQRVECPAVFDSNPITALQFHQGDESLQLSGVSASSICLWKWQVPMKVPAESESPTFTRIGKSLLVFRTCSHLPSRRYQRHYRAYTRGWTTLHGIRYYWWMLSNLYRKLRGHNGRSSE